MEWAAHTPARNLRARKRRFDMKRVSRRGFMQGGAALATAGFVGRGALAKEASLQEDKRPPNILWITMEDTSPQFIGCYGNKSARTPNMDRMASEGVRFTRAFSTAPVCAPSRCSIITGCHTAMPTHCRLVNRSISLSLTYRTYATFRAIVNNSQFLIDCSKHLYQGDETNRPITSW